MCSGTWRRLSYCGDDDDNDDVMFNQLGILGTTNQLASLSPAYQLDFPSSTNQLASLGPVYQLASLSPANQLVSLSPVNQLASLIPANKLASLSPANQLVSLSPYNHLKAILNKKYQLVLEKKKCGFPRGKSRKEIHGLWLILQVLSKYQEFNIKIIGNNAITYFWFPIGKPFLAAYINTPKTKATANIATATASNTTTATDGKYCWSLQLRGRVRQRRRGRGSGRWGQN